MSIFDTVTVEMFKEYYNRDFPYLPVYNSYLTYWKDDIVYDEFTETFYKSLIDDNQNNLSDAESWVKVKGDVRSYITDNDIEKAMSQAKLNSSTRFGETCNDKVTIYLHLIAFYLCVDIQNASSGVNSSYKGALASKSVDGVSVSYNIPQWMMDSPMYSLYSQNGYGLKYLSLIAPYLACTVLFSTGRSTTY